MGLQKPAKSKAPAFVATIGNTPSVPVLDPCCLPGGVTNEPLLGNHSGDSSTAGKDATHHIMEPTRH